jgi:hypothetical protein
MGSTMKAESSIRTTDVLVAGAGPVDLTMDWELHQHGVGCRIIDPLPEQASQCTNAHYYGVSYRWGAQIRLSIGIKLYRSPGTSTPVP